MTPRLLFRSLTPLGWLLAAVVAIALVAIAGRGLGLRWDPFGFDARRLAAAERQAETATAEAFARRLEVEGAAARSVQREQYHQRAADLARATAAAEAEARNAQDAQILLEPDRAARLRAHDGELCRIAAGLCRAAQTGLAAGGSDPVPAGQAPRQADLG